MIGNFPAALVTDELVELSFNRRFSLIIAMSIPGFGKRRKKKQKEKPTHPLVEKAVLVGVMRFVVVVLIIKLRFVVGL